MVVAAVVAAAGLEELIRRSLKGLLSILINPDDSDDLYMIVSNDPSDQFEGHFNANLRVTSRPTVFILIAIVLQHLC